MSYNFNQIFKNEIGNESKTDETQKKIDDKDNTLMKYFIEEKMNNTKNDKINQISFDKIELFYKKPIKLRNTLKKCYWDRQSIVIFIILRIVPYLSVYKNYFLLSS